MRLSVTISAYNQHELTVVHVRECMNSELMPDEIIVVNDGGDDCLKDMLKKLEKKTDIIYARITDDIEWNYTGARNLGVWLSRGNYIAIEDNDNIPMPNFYKNALELFDKDPDMGRICGLRRPKVDLEDALNNPSSEWKIYKSRPFHRDTGIVKRDIFLKLKGYDERFAGRYGWCSSDWIRRLNRAEIKQGNVDNYWSIVGGDTLDLIRRKSYRNYEMARKKTHIRAPGPILNFDYEFEKL